MNLNWIKARKSTYGIVQASDEENSVVSVLKQLISI